MGRAWIAALAALVCGCGGERDGVDAGGLDAGLDAARFDSGPPDAGPPDAPPVVDAGPPDAGPPPPPKPAEEYVDALCTKLSECCTFSEMGAWLQRFGLGSYGDCRLVLRTWLEGTLLPTLSEAEEAGRLALDEEAFTSCAADVRTLSCDDVAARPALEAMWPGFGCDAAVTALVPLGGSCLHALECESGACQRTDGEGAGTCVSIPGRGEPCPALVCPAGLVCDDFFGCTEPLPDDTPCFDHFECASGQCVRLAPGSGSCGSMCDGGGAGPTTPPQRVFENIVIEDMVAGCRAAMTCCSAEDRAELGYPYEARDENECRVRYSNSTLMSQYAFVLEGLELERMTIDAAAARACLASIADCSSAVGPWALFYRECDWLRGVLENRRSCSISAECRSLYCRSGRCADRPGEDWACLDGVCADELYCDDSDDRCRPRKEPGGSCMVDWECADALCVGEVSPDTPGSCATVCDGA